MIEKQPFKERVQGAAAHESGKRRNAVVRTLLKLAAGKRSPTVYAEAQLAKRGQQWQESENQNAASLSRRRGEAAVAKGVEAGKLAYVQAAGSRNKREAAAALKLLLETSANTRSWEEFQSSLAASGRRVSELPVWQEAIAQDYELYQLVLNNRPDRLPDVIQAAEQRAGFGYTDSRLDTVKLNLLAKYSLEEAINRFFAIGAVAGWDKSFFEEIGRISDAELSQMLFNRLDAIKGLGSTGGEVLGRLGGPKATAINSALAPIGKSYNSLLA